jgi:hypothetical protein
MRALLLLIVTGAGLWAHGFHCSLATVDYVTKSHALQAILVVNAGDLETLLRQQTGRQIELDRTADAAALVAAYVQRSVHVRGGGRELPMKWVGMEIKTNMAYLYVETEAPALDGLEIKNELLLDLLPDQVNMLTLRRDGKGKPFDCLFQQGSGFVPIKLAD